MERKKESGVRRAGVLLSFILMIAGNILAERLPLFGVTTAEISERYPNLVSPPDLSFAIWGVIYLLLALSVLYQAGVIGKGEGRSPEGLLSKLAPHMILGALFNLAWILAWHADRIGLSLLILVGLFACLIALLEILRGREASRKEFWFLQVPFAIYAAWLCVALAANVTVLRVKLGWNFFGLSESGWTILILALLTVLALVLLYRFRLPAMGLVFLWALGGILAKHLSPGGFDGSYPGVVAALAAAIVLILLSSLHLLRAKRAEKGRK